jgi:TRAF3-interacting protein 1
MTEKLLKKPPPKYIYDIILNTMKKTSFPNGLLTDQEMDHKYFEADPRNKLAILQKVIDITKIVMNDNFEIKTTNILKGDQPEKTNYFLQMFYKAATNGKDNTPLIQKYLENQTKKETKKKSPSLKCPKISVKNPSQKSKNQ